jgi:hypothetical protein
MQSASTLCGALGILLTVAGGYRPALADEEATVKAFAIWTAEGRTFQTADQEATFVGSLVGPMFVEEEKGLVASGRIACPVIIEIGLQDGRQHGEGRCTITAQDGARIYAQITCTGVHLVGCNGELKLTGGTERFAGISGGGKATVRGSLRQITPADSSVREEATGSLSLFDLHYKLP